MCFIQIGVAKAGAEHGACAWEEDVEDQAHVSPDVVQFWNIGHEFPGADVGLGH